jgi:hypothetical protein
MLGMGPSTPTGIDAPEFATETELTASAVTLSRLFGRRNPKSYMSCRFGIADTRRLLPFWQIPEHEGQTLSRKLHLSNHLEQIVWDRHTRCYS